MYSIFEMQTTNGVTVNVNPVTKATIEEALQEFYTKAAAAAVSSVGIHTVMLVNAEGQNVRNPICCKHQVQE